MAGRGHQFGHIMQEAEIVSGSPAPERIRTAEVMVEFPKGQWC
jgi:hypothetical protein